MQRSDFTALIIICLLTMSAVATVFMNQAIFLELAAFFHISTASARFSFSMVSLSYSVTFLFAGPCMDSCNLPKVSIWSSFCLAAVLLAASFTGSYQGFVSCMIPIGVFAALVPASMFPYIATIAPDRKKGLYVGAIVASSTMGVIFGRVLSGIVTAIASWSMAYIATSLLVLTLSLCMAFLVPSFRGTIIKNKIPVLKMYKNLFLLLSGKRTIALLLLGASLFFGFIGIVTFLSYRLNNAPFNFSSGQIGWISFTGITALIAPVSGQLAAKFNIDKIIFYGLAAALAACFIVWKAISIPLISIGLLLLFLSVYTCQPLIFMKVGDNVPAESLGSASSLYIFFCIGGGSLASIFLGPVWIAFGWTGIILACSSSIAVGLALLIGSRSDSR